MAYRRRYRKRSYRKRRTASRGKIYGRAAGQLWRDVKKLKNFINVEFKHHETELDSTIFDSGTVQCQNLLTLGDGASDIDGQQCRFKSIQCYCRTQMQASTPAVCRIIYFIDLQARGTAPGLADVLATGVSSYAVTCPRNLNNRKRFVILKDHIFTLTPMQPVREFKYYRKLDLKTVYDINPSGDVSDIQSNPIYILFISDQPSGSTAPIITHSSRLRYIDN